MGIDLRERARGQGRVVLDLTRPWKFATGSHVLVPLVVAVVAVVTLLTGRSSFADDKPATPAVVIPPEVARGQYVFQVAGCKACHTAEGAALVAGGPPLATPFGTFFAPNITPDDSHGIGTWKDGDLAGALGKGVAPDGSHYFPVFPYPSYTKMRDADVSDLQAYLRSIPADATPRKEHDIPWYVGFRFLNWFWKLLFFDEGRYVDKADRSPAWNRGAYLANGLAHCGECHTPRNVFGAVDSDNHLAGNAEGPEGEFVPNITAHDEHGIGLWSPADIVWYLTSGGTPDGDYAGGAMAEVIDEGLQHLSETDAAALAEYLRELPANPHQP